MAIPETAPLTGPDAQYIQWQYAQEATPPSQVTGNGIPVQYIHARVELLCVRNGDPYSFRGEVDMVRDVGMGTRGNNRVPGYLFASGPV